MKNFYLIRHAQTDHNKELRFTGITDIPISEDSFPKVEGVADFFKDIDVDKIYVSELSRTVQTVQPLIDQKGIKPIVNPGVNEADFGDYETFTIEEILAKEPEFYENTKKLRENYKFPNGESMQMAYNRHRDAFKKIVEETKDGETVVIGTHGGFIKNVMSYIVCDDVRAHWRFFPENICMTQIIDDDGFLKIRIYNQYIGR